MSLVTMLVVFGTVGGIAWAIVASHAHIEFPSPEQKSNSPVSNSAENGLETKQDLPAAEANMGRFAQLLGVENQVYQEHGCLQNNFHF